MEVELEHHYGWTRHSYPQAKDIHHAAYLAVRECCDFLTDENHSHDAGEHELTWGGKTSTFMSVRIYRGEGAPPYTGPAWAATDYWFAMNYRKPSNR